MDLTNMTENEEENNTRLNDLNWKLQNVLQEQEETQKKQAQIELMLQENIQTIKSLTKTIQNQEKVINLQNQELSSIKLSPDYDLIDEHRRVKEQNADLLRRNQEQEAQHELTIHQKEAEIMYLKAQCQELKVKNIQLNEQANFYKMKIKTREVELKNHKNSTKNRLKAELIHAIIKLVRNDCTSSLQILLEASDSTAKGQNGICDYFQELLTIETKPRKQLALTFLHMYPKLGPFSNHQTLTLEEIAKRVSPAKYLIILNILNFFGTPIDEKVHADFFQPGIPIGSIKPAEFASNFLEKHPSYYLPLCPRAREILVCIKAKVRNADYERIQLAIFSDQIGTRNVRKLFFDFVGSDLISYKAAYNFVAKSGFLFRSTWAAMFWK